MGSLGAANSAGEAWRTTAQDRHAFGDERDPLSPTNRLPVAVFAARGLPAALDGNRRACGPSFDRFAAARNASASKSPRSLIAAPIANSFHPQWSNHKSGD